VATHRLNANFICAACGHESSRWMGRCPRCLQWNSMIEESAPPRDGAPGGRERARASGGSTSLARGERAQALSSIETRIQERSSTGYAEFDTVIGGGLVAGASILLGGEPGIGKSTLLLQTARAFAARFTAPSEKLATPSESPSGGVLYVGAEESANQIALRAARLREGAAGGAKQADIHILSSGALETILDSIAELQPRLVIVDSIQAVYTSAVNASPGSVSQIRECAWVLTEECRRRESALILSGHVTKDGGLAGPKILEHMVDTVLYFEGSRDRELRIIRSVKNRFGNVNEIAVFLMTAKGLREIADPGGIFIEGIAKGAQAGPGSILTAALEGNRVLLAEVQALVTSRVSGSIVRTTDGVEANRVQRVRAILENQLGIQLGDQDTFVNVTGGLEINEPAVELAIAAAIFGSVRGLCPDSRLIVAGEIGLLGDLRRIPQAEKRVAQARKLGLDAVVLPEANRSEFPNLEQGPQQNPRGEKPALIFAERLRDALAIIFPQ